MDLNIEKLPIQPIVYMRRIGAYGPENHKLMEALKEWATRHGLLNDSVIYGIAYDNEHTPPEKCRYDVCLVAADCPADESVQCGEIPAGQYAVFTIPHTAEAIQKFYGTLIQALQEKGLQFENSKPILERYKKKLVDDGYCEFCVPVKE